MVDRCVFFQWTKPGRGVRRRRYGCTSRHQKFGTNFKCYDFMYNLEIQMNSGIQGILATSNVGSQNDGPKLPPTVHSHHIRWMVQSQNSSYSNSLPVPLSMFTRREKGTPHISFVIEQQAHNVFLSFIFSCYVTFPLQRLYIFLRLGWVPTQAGIHSTKARRRCQ